MANRSSVERRRARGSELVARVFAPSAITAADLDSVSPAMLALSVSDRSARARVRQTPAERAQRAHPARCSARRRRWSRRSASCSPSCGSSSSIGRSRSRSSRRSSESSRRRRAQAERGRGARRALRSDADADRPDVEARLVQLYKLGRAGYWRLLLDVDDLRALGRAYRTAAALTASDRERVQAAPAHARRAGRRSARACRRARRS